MSLTLKIGQRVEVSNKNVQGVVSFIGNTHFAKGTFIGITLDEPKGKHDGTFQGKTYFQCKENHGIFVRQGHLIIISDTGSRIDLSSSVTSIGSSEDGFTTPPTTNKVTRLTSSAQTPRETRSREDVSSSATVPPLGAKRSSFVEQSKGKVVGTPTGIPRRASKLTHTQVKQMTPSPMGSQESLGPERKARITEFVETLTPEFTPGQVVGPPASSAPALASSAISQIQGLTAPQKAAQQQVNDQHNKQIKELNDNIKDLSEKLETMKIKYKEKSHELEQMKIQLDQSAEFKSKIMESQTSLKKELERVKKEKDEAMEARGDLGELTDMLEMATLDKEMAEEKVEALQRDLESALEKINDLEMQIELMKVERMELVEGATGDDPSVVNLKVKQLESQNEKLKETLVRLRDLSAHEKHEKQKLEKDYEEIKSEMDTLSKSSGKLKSKVEEMEEQISELHSQVDAALGAEEMVEALGLQKLTLEDKVKELEEAVAELEELQDINEQLQEGFREQEQDFRQELDMKNRQVWDAERKIESVLESLADRELTIVKFRELVHKIQDENLDLRTRLDQKSLPAATKLPAEFMDFKKMFAETKAHARAIDLELRHMEVEQAQQHVQYLLAFMPDSFINRGGDHEALLVVLLMPRLLNKCRVLLNQLKDKFPSVDAVERSSISHAVHQFAARSRFSAHLHLLQASLHQFVHGLNTCTPETLLKAGATYPEMVQQEKILDSYIDLLKRDHLDENVNTEALERMVKYFNSVHGPLLLGNNETEIHQGLLITDVGKAILCGIDSIATDCAILQVLLKTDSDGVGEMAKRARVWCETMRQQIRQIIRQLDAISAISIESKQSVDLSLASQTIAKLARLIAAPAKAALHAYIQDNETLATDPLCLEAMAKVYEKLVDCDRDKGVLDYVNHSMDSLSTHVANVSLTLLDLVDKYQPSKKPVRVPPLTMRAKAVKAELNATNTIRGELEQRNEKIREMKMALRKKQEELSEMVIRKDMVESKLAIVTKDKETIETSLQKKIDELQVSFKKKEHEFETTYDHLSKDIENLEKEKRELKDKLKSNPKKGPVSYEVVKPVQPLVGIEIQGNMKVVESPILISQIHCLKSELNLERSKRMALQLRASYEMFKKLKKLSVITKPNEEEIKRINELKKELICLEDEIIDVSMPTLPDFSKHKYADKGNIDHIKHWMNDDYLKKKHVYNKYLELQNKINKEILLRNKGSCVETDLTIFPTPELAKALKEKGPVKMCEITVATKDSSLSGKVLDLEVSLSQLSALKKKIFSIGM